MSKNTTNKTVRCDRFIPFRDSKNTCDYKSLFKQDQCTDENSRLGKSSILNFKPSNSLKKSLFDENFAPKETGAFKKSKDNSIVSITESFKY